MDKLKAAYRRTSIVGMAMLASLFMYLIVAVAIQTTQDPFEGFASFEGSEMLRNIFLALSLMQVVGIKIIQSRVMSIPSPVPAAGKPADLSRLAGILATASIVNFALAESIAVYGLVLFLLNGRTTDFFIFLGLSFLAFVLFFPKYDQWEELAKRQA